MTTLWEKSSHTFYLTFSHSLLQQHWTRAISKHAAHIFPSNGPSDKLILLFKILLKITISEMCCFPKTVGSFFDTPTTPCAILPFCRCQIKMITGMAIFPLDYFKKIGVSIIPSLESSPVHGTQVQWMINIKYYQHGDRDVVFYSSWLFPWCKAAPAT